MEMVLARLEKPESNSVERDKRIRNYFFLR